MPNCLKTSWHSVCKAPKPKEPGLNSITADVCGEEVGRGEERGVERRLGVTWPQVIVILYF